mgnify:CR=1 FL=1
MQPKEKINKMKNEAFYDLIDNRINQITDIFKENVHLKKQNENQTNYHGPFSWGCNVKRL